MVLILKKTICMLSLNLLIIKKNCICFLIGYAWDIYCSCCMSLHQIRYNYFVKNYLHVLICLPKISVILYI